MQQKFEEKYASLSEAQKKDPLWFNSLANSYAKEHHVRRVDFLDATGNRYFHYESEKKLSPIFEKRFDEMLPNELGTSLHHLIPSADGVHILFYMIRLLFNHEKEVIIKIAIPIENHMIKALDVYIETMVITTIMTISLVVLLIFPIVYQQFRQLQDSEIKLLQSNLGTIRALGNSIAQRDSDTHEHNYRVTYYAIELAKLYGLRSERFGSILKGSFLHDIGKIGIPDSILHKPSKLTEEEFEIMKEHVNLGLKTIKQIEWLNDAQGIVGGHHEKFDGTGYPLGIKGEEISIEARIFAVVDVFDALTSKRPYKEPYSIEKSLAIIQESSGSHFDPKVVFLFESIAFELHEKLVNMHAHELGEATMALARPYQEFLL
ncbi:MAG: HD domain-containing phosphohydrolase [Campylobacterota bacterium]|nr:HD domain-containing phosphohydrolase [Campylobacterota bacterium]